MIALIVAGYLALVALVLAFLNGATRKDPEAEIEAARCDRKWDFDVPTEPTWLKRHTEDEQSLMRLLTGVHEPTLECHVVCIIHNPSDGAHRALPIIWRNDRAIFERLCRHGVGHPDPDQLYYWAVSGQMHQQVHGCDGCCVGWALLGFGTMEDG